MVKPKEQKYWGDALDASYTVTSIIFDRADIRLLEAKGFKVLRFSEDHMNDEVCLEIQPAKRKMSR